MNVNEYALTHGLRTIADLFENWWYYVSFPLLSHYFRIETFCTQVRTNYFKDLLASDWNVEVCTLNEAHLFVGKWIHKDCASTNRQFFESKSNSSKTKFELIQLTRLTNDVRNSTLILTLIRNNYCAMVNRL